MVTMLWSFDSQKQTDAFCCPVIRNVQCVAQWSNLLMSFVLFKPILAKITFSAMVAVK